MTAHSLRTVTLKTVANYSRAAERAVGAYRAGGRRLIALVQRGVDQAAERGAQRLAPRLAAALHSASHRVGQLATQGVEAVSSRTEQVIGLGASGVTSQIERVAVLAGGVDFPVVVSGLQVVARLSLPGAQAALALSERVAAGADKLYGASGARRPQAKAAARRARRAAPAPVGQAKLYGASGARRPQAKAAARRARRAAPAPVGQAAKAVRKTVAQVEAVVEAPAQAVVKRVRAAAKPVKQALATTPPKAATRSVRPAKATKAAKPVATPAAAARRRTAKASPVVQAAQDAVAAVTAAVAG